jgi:hypothetical protein
VKERKAVGTMRKSFYDGFTGIDAYPIERSVYIRSKTIRYSFTQEDVDGVVWDIVEDFSTGEYYYLHI